jgi:hypothetical protein
MRQALMNLDEFTDLFGDCVEYETKRLGEFLIWRADHPALGKIIGVQGESTRILTFTEKQLSREAP